MAKKENPSNLPVYDQHPVALKLMPGGMQPDEFEAFCEDVAARGILFPITIFEGKVLDGWHRYRAAHKTGTRFSTIEYSGKDPAGYVAACNIMRRKLSSLQRALVGARIHLEHAFTQAEVCKRFTISNTVLAMVLKAIDNRNTMIIRRIENDSEYTRGMLRDELEEAGIVHANYGRSKDPSKIANSVFDMARVNGGEHDDFRTEGSQVEESPAPTRKASHPEHRAKNTGPQNLQNRFDELMPDEKVTFIQMIWPKARPIAEKLGLPGLQSTMAAAKVMNKVITKAAAKTVPAKKSKAKAY